MIHLLLVLIQPASKQTIKALLDKHRATAAPPQGGKAKPPEAAPPPATSAPGKAEKEVKPPKASPPEAESKPSTAKKGTAKPSARVRLDQMSTAWITYRIYIHVEIFAVD